MKNLNEFSKLFFVKKNKYESDRDKLQEAYDDADFNLRRLEKPMLKDIIKPLALAMQEELKAKAYYVVDIGSIWQTVTIHWVMEDDMTKCKNKDHVAKLEIDRYESQWVIIEKDGYGKKQRMNMYKNKGIKWLAKYAKQKLLNEGIYN